jgi:hypothetical protein
MSSSMKSHLKTVLVAGGMYDRAAMIGEAAIADRLVRIERQIEECVADAA